MTIPLAGAPAPALTPEMKADFDHLVASHDLVLFMKGTPEAPQCGFSNRAARALDATGRAYHAVNVFAQPDIFRYMRALAEYADFPTLPQVWVKGELIGGSDIAAQMVESGELQKMLA